MKELLDRMEFLGQYQCSVNTKIYGMCHMILLAKNEEDALNQALDYFKQWKPYGYLYINGHIMYKYEEK